MPPAITLALALINELTPIIESEIQKGTITPEQQQAAHDLIDSCRLRVKNAIANPANQAPEYIPS